MTTYTLTNQIQGFVVIGDKIHDAKIIGIEVNGEDTNDDKLVVLVKGDDGYHAHRVDTAYFGEYQAAVELERRQHDRRAVLTSTHHTNRSRNNALHFFSGYKND